MAEIQSRPSASTRGRGSGRGGRGGISSRGGRASTRSPNANGDPSFEDEGEIGTLKKTYSSKIAQIHEIFPDWSDVDLAFALQETSGDVDTTVTRIMDGSISQWGEVSSHKKHHGRTKAKESAPTPETAATKPARGGRIESGRGGRGRASERGARGTPRARGASHVASNGGRHKESQALSIPTENAWGDAAPASEGWGTEDTSSPKKSIAAPVAAPAVPKAAPVKTWASMLRQSTESKPAPKAAEAPGPKPAEPIEPHPAVESESREPPPVEAEPVVEPEPVAEAIEEEQEEKPEAATVVPTVIEPEVALVPSKDQLTETNLEQVTDTSNPPATATAASTTADSWDPRHGAPSATATPVSASQQQHQTTAKAATTVPVVSGYAATAQKATERASRGPSHHQRRVLDQEEAVRMPGHREVDRATVQFGAFSLGDEEDVDEDREEAETRAQPPADSPISHPRASLPPVQPAPVPEAFPAAKQPAPVATAPVSSIPTGPAASSVPAAAAPPTGPSATSAVPTGPAGAPTQPAAASQQPPQASQQYGRFSQPGAQDQPGFPQKSYDSFAGQTPTPSVSQSQSQYESGLPAQVSQPQQGPIQQPTGGAFSSAPADYPYYATADQTNRGGPYNSYYAQQYGAAQQQQQQAQQAGQGQPQVQQEGGLASQQQRGFGGYSNPQSDNMSQYPQSAAQASRFGAAAAAAEAQNSGNNTPNPTQNQPVAAQGNQAQSHGQFGGGAGGAGAGAGAGGGGGYNTHPYYNSPYYSNFMYGQGNYGGNYGGGPYGKGAGGGGGAYGQPHQYGMSPQGAPFDHSSSGNAGFGQGAIHRGDSVLSSGLGDYQRGASSQMGNQPGVGGAGSFGGMHDTFGRGGSGYPTQAGQGGYNAQANQPGNAGSGADDLKPPYGDSKVTGGPSPSLSAAARPGSAANTAASQSGLPPPQSNQPGMAGYGGYPSHLQGQHAAHGNQTASSGTGYGMGGGAGQGHSNAFPYGNQYGGQSYYNQQQRGWGGNYH